MRASAIYDLLVDVVEGITPDEQASVGDVFRHDPDQTDNEVRPERSFIIEQGQLSPSETFVPKTVSTVLRLRVYYVDDPGVGRRIAADGERIIAALAPLHGNGTYVDKTGATRTVDATFHACTELGDWVPAQAEQIEATIDVRAKYTLTGV